MIQIVKHSHNSALIYHLKWFGPYLVGCSTQFMRIYRSLKAAKRQGFAAKSEVLPIAHG